jgi:hypothetical protein
MNPHYPTFSALCVRVRASFSARLLETNKKNQCPSFTIEYMNGRKYNLNKGTRTLPQR